MDTAWSPAVVEVVTEEPAEEPSPQELSALGLVELVLKQPDRLDALNRMERRQAETIPRFVGIALAGYTVFGVAMLIILNAAPAAAYPHRVLPVPAARWSDTSALGLVLAYDFGLVGATGICLPTFYFFALLAGVRMSMLQLTAHVVRCKAASALMLLGILPVYVAVVLGLVVFKAPAETLEGWLYLGLVLPFLAGLEGVRCIYRGVWCMADTLPEERRVNRGCFLRRLTVSWAAVYTAVSPLLIYRLWQIFAGGLS